MGGAGGFAARYPGGNERAHRVIVEGRQAELLNLVRAFEAPSGLASVVDGRQQHPDQDADDRDHYEQLDQRETARHGARPCRAPVRRVNRVIVVSSPTQTSGSFDRLTIIRYRRGTGAICAQNRCRALYPPIEELQQN